MYGNVLSSSIKRAILLTICIGLTNQSTSWNGPVFKRENKILLCEQANKKIKTFFAKTTVT